MVFFVCFFSRERSNIETEKSSHLFFFGSAASRAAARAGAAVDSERAVAAANTEAVVAARAARSISMPLFLSFFL